VWQGREALASREKVPVRRGRQGGLHGRGVEPGPGLKLNQSAGRKEVQRDLTGEESGLPPPGTVSHPPRTTSDKGFDTAETHKIECKVKKTERKQMATMVLSDHLTSHTLGTQ
jgi:hypothetical protein